MAGEFRRNTANSMLLITPGPRESGQAKQATSALVGAGLAMAASVLSVGIALPWVAAKNVQDRVLISDVGSALLGAMAASTLCALVGVGLGWLFRNQTAAVVVALVWVMIAGSHLVRLVPEIGEQLRGGAATALTGADTAESGFLPHVGGRRLVRRLQLDFGAAGTRFVLERDVP